MKRLAPADQTLSPGAVLRPPAPTTEPGDDPVRTGLAHARRAAPSLQVVGAALRPATVLPLCLLAAALVPVSFVTSGPSLCPFKVATGLPCPGCGLTRSVVTLLHGEIATSLYFHPLGIVLVAVCAALALADAWIWWRESAAGRPSSSTWLLNRVVLTPAPWVAISALTLVWFVRLPLYVAGIWVF